METGADQLILDLGFRPALGAEDFIVGRSNEAALAMIERWPDWPARALLIVGPAGSGKTHLAHVWRLASAAGRVVAGEAVEPRLVALGDQSAAVIEDLDQGIADEQALFHLLNQSRERRIDLLLTARTPPGHWSVRLPDLRSRVRSLPVIAIETPDEVLLQAVLVKLLSDRQLPATPHAVRHLARHMDRSMSVALRLVEAIDRALWQRPREVTRDLARKVLAEIARSGDYE